MYIHPVKGICGRRPLHTLSPLPSRYLRNLMNAQNAVPIADIARFNKMKAICEDNALLMKLIPEVSQVAGSSETRARNRGQQA